MLHRHYPASLLLRASPPPATAQSVPRGPLVGALRSCCGGFPVYHRAPLPTCRHPYPGELARCSLRSLPARYQPSPCFNWVGVRIHVFSRLTRCSFILRPAGSLISFVTFYHQRLQLHPLLGAVAPAATGGAKVAGWVLLTSPLKSCASTAH